MKTGQSRIDDAVDYIFKIGKSDLANHVFTVVQTGNVSSIGNELSLGSRTGNSHTPQYATDTSKRTALRALLLCQRVYFSDLWAEVIVIGGARSRYNHLTAGWKGTSLAHWSPRTEQEIIDAILTFSVTTANAGAIADAAVVGAPAGTHPSLTLTRNITPFPGLTSCYGAVMTWLFQSGMVSYRWYLKHSGASNERTLREAFGGARVIWQGSQQFTAADNLPIVPRGHIVHLYVDNPMRWNGHWLVSHGDGTAAGCNNDSHDGTNTNYTRGCSLNNQFLNGYKHSLASGGLEQGVAEVINPLEIASRI